MQGYFESKEFKENLAYFEESRKKGESVFLDSDQLTDIAEYYHWMGRSDEALEVADYALSIFQGATSPLVLKSRIALLVDNDPEKAMALAEEIVDKFDLDYYYIKAEIMIVTNKADQADLYLETCSEQVDDEEYDDYLLDVATLFTDYEQTVYAKKWLEMSVEIDLPDYREQLGRIRYFEKDYEDSIRIFEELADESPYNTFYWDMLACSQLAMGRLGDTLTSSEFAIAINPNDESALLYKGQALMRMKDYDAAIPYFDRHGKIRPSNVDGPINAALCHIYLGDYRDGVALLQQAEDAAERYCPERKWEVYQEEAFAYSQFNDLGRALSYIDKMETLKDNDPDESMVLRGHLYLEHFRPAQAHECFKKAIEHSHYSCTIMMRIAVSLYDNDYIKSAYDMLKNFTPNDLAALPQTYAYLAISAHDLGHHDEYLEYLRLAVEKSPSAARTVLAPLFPDEMETSEYYNYAIKEHHQ